jgi:hypothetical protein
MLGHPWDSRLVLSVIVTKKPSENVDFRIRWNFIPTAHDILGLVNTLLVKDVPEVS